MRCIRGFPKNILAVGVVAIVVAIAAPAAHAVILCRSAIRNKTAPTGTNLNSGWQWEASWAGAFTGTPIAPHYFLSAAHLGGAVGQPITFRGVNYKTTAAYVTRARLESCFGGNRLLHQPGPQYRASRQNRTEHCSRRRIGPVPTVPGH
jgi:hypothetical protein